MRLIYSPENIPYTVALASMALAAFFCGEQFFFYRKNKKLLQDYSIKLEEKNISFRLDNKTAKMILICIGSLCYLIYILQAGGLSAFTGVTYTIIRGGYSSGSFSAYCFMGYNICSYTLMIYEIKSLVKIRSYSIRTYIQAWSKMSLVWFAITQVPFLIGGDRGIYLLFFTLLIAPYFLFVKPLDLKKAVLGAIIGAVLLSLTGAARDAYNFSWSEALQKQSETISKPGLWPTMELGNSYGTFNIASSYFPHLYDYNYGLNTFYSLANIVPFSSYLTEITKKNSTNEYIYSSALFFTYIINKGSFSSGAGTSILADLYIDYGPYGLPVFLFAWGMTLGWLNHKAKLHNSEIFIFYFSYFSYVAFYINRARLFSGFNILIFTFIFYNLINNIMKYRIISGPSR